MVQTTSAESMNIDSDMKWNDFLKYKVNTFVKWDLVRFFHDNPHTADTGENIARYVGRDAQICQRELEGLVTSGLLEMKRAGKVVIYRLTSQPELRQQIADFMTACHDRDFRIKAINRLARRPH